MVNVNGNGLLKRPDGTKYEGGWLNNEKHGHGLFEDASGFKYVG